MHANCFCSCFMYTLVELIKLLNQHSAGIVILVALFIWDNKKEEEQLAQISRDETLSRLPLRLSTNRIVELVQLRDSVRPVSTFFFLWTLSVSPVSIFLFLNVHYSMYHYRQVGRFVSFSFSMFIIFLLSFHYSIDFCCLLFPPQV